MDGKKRVRFNGTVCARALAFGHQEQIDDVIELNKRINLSRTTSIEFSLFVFILLFRVGVAICVWCVMKMNECGRVCNVYIYIYRCELIKLKKRVQFTLKVSVK